MDRSYYKAVDCFASDPSMRPDSSRRLSVGDAVRTDGMLRKIEIIGLEAETKGKKHG